MSIDKALLSDHKASGEFQGGNQATFTRDALTSNIECGAVVDAGSDNRQPKRHVHHVTKLQQFDGTVFRAFIKISAALNNLREELILILNRQLPIKA